MLPVVHIYIDCSEAETWNHDEIDNLQGKINTGEYSMRKYSSQEKADAM